MRVVVADDQAEVRSALRLVVEQQDDMTLVGEFAHLVDLQAGLCGLRPDLVLLDWELDGIPGAALVATCRTACPSARVIALSGRLQSPHIVLAAGADGFVGKHESPKQLLRTLRTLEREHQQAVGGEPFSRCRGYDDPKEDPCA